MDVVFLSSFWQRGGARAKLLRCRAACRRRGHRCSLRVSLWDDVKKLRAWAVLRPSDSHVGTEYMVPSLYQLPPSWWPMVCCGYDGTSKCQGVWVSGCQDARVAGWQDLDVRVEGWKGGRAVGWQGVRVRTRCLIRLRPGVAAELPWPRLF